MPQADSSQKTDIISKGWKERSLTVLGLSKSGIAISDYVLRHGGQVFLSEVLPATPANEAQRHSLETLGAELEMGGHTKQVYTHSDQVVVSPGIPPSSPVINQLKITGREVISEVELAYRENKATHQAQWIGITGTNGKTTTTTLLAKILQASGKNAPACGNIGLPVMTCLNDALPDFSKPDVLVTELSSFQLEFSPTLTADMAIFLNLAPDHLNWHGSLEAYKRAKLRLFVGEQSPKWIVMNGDDPFSESIARHTTAKIIGFFRASKNSKKRDGYENRIYVKADGMIVLELADQAPIEYFNVNELKVIGVHNQDNVMAAIATAHLAGVSPEIIRLTCLAFVGVEHRLEQVLSLDTEKGAIRFYNDSKATNTDAVISALRAFETEKVILIAGGRDKSEDLTALTEAIKSRAEKVVLIGEAQKRFAEALGEKGFSEIYFSDSLEAGVKQAFSLSTASFGESILFSPACASFDLYKNFEERGQAFKDFVYNIKETL